MGTLPSNCCFCNKVFNIKEDAKSWRISQGDDEVLIACPDCFGKLDLTPANQGVKGTTDDS